MKRKINNKLFNLFLFFGPHTNIDSHLLNKLDGQLGNQFSTDTWGQVDNNLCKEIEGFQHVAGN